MSTDQELCCFHEDPILFEYPQFVRALAEPALAHGRSPVRDIYFEYGVLNSDLV